MEYEIIYSSRRTVTLQILPDGRMVVRAPYGAPKADLERFVAGNRKWIEQTQDRIAAQNAERERFCLTEGARIPFLGEELPIVLQPGIRHAAIGRQGILLAPLSEEEKRTQLAAVFAKEAKAYLPPRVDYWSQQTGLHCTGLTITSARTRWGSCSGKNSLALSRRLMHASPQAIDAVIVHELCHVRYHDHSDRFYNLLSKLYPEYKMRGQELKELQKKLMHTVGYF